MPTCKRCNNHFPNKIKINSKERNLQRRKFCLDCSPFGSHNTSKLCLNDGNIKCFECKKTKPKEQFYNRTEGGIQYICKECSSKKVSTRRKDNKIKSMEYKGGQCIICGYNKSIRAMKFHHIDPDKKEYIITGKMCSFEKLKTELDKCILVCGNCHDEIHDGFHPQYLIINLALGVGLEPTNLSVTV